MDTFPRGSVPEDELNARSPEYHSKEKLRGRNMRKYTILLSLALVALLAVGAAAQSINTTVTGKVGVYGQYDQEDHFTARGLLYARLAISNVRGVNVEVDFGNVAEHGRSNEADRRSWSSFGNDLFAPTEPLNLNIEAARVIVEGAYWPGGPEVKTTIGRQRINWNSVVASDSNNSRLRGNAFLVEGLDLGGIALDFAHMYQLDQPDRVNLLRARANLDVVDLTGIVVGREDTVDPAERAMDLAVLAKVEPADGISVDGIVARDGQSEELHYRLNATLETIENFTLKGSFWSTGEDFNPRYRHHNWADSELTKTNNSGVRQDEATAFSVTAETTQGGIDLSATFASAGKHSDANYRRSFLEVGAETKVQDFDVSATYELTQETGSNDNSKITLGLGTDLASVRVDYEGVIETDKDMVNSIAAKTTIDTVIAEGINLSGKVTLDPNDADFETRIEADAEWRAPNGIGLGLHYANYNRAFRLNKGNTDTLRHNGVSVIKVGDDSEADGFYVTASYVVEF